MRNLALRAAVLSTLGHIAAGTIGLTAMPASADWVSLPTTAFTISTPSANQPTGSTAYLRCNTTGNYGSAVTTTPTTTADACHLVPPSGNRNNSPQASISTELATRIAPLVINNSYTSGTNITVGQIEERVWGNGSSIDSSSTCIYGLRLSLYEDVDYNLTEPGTQTIEFNGFARGGFGSKTVHAGYYYSSATDEAVFRVGRAFTSVQVRADLADDEVLATGYVHRPLISPAPATGTAVNGVSTYTDPLATPTAGQQTAALRTNWVEFSTDNNADDDDGTSKPDSSQMYVRVTGSGAGTTTSGCPAKSGGSAALTSNAYRFRQVGQEEAPLFEFTMSGYVPNGGNTNF